MDEENQLNYTIYLTNKMYNKNSFENNIILNLPLF